MAWSLAAFAIFVVPLAALTMVRKRNKTATERSSYDSGDSAPEPLPSTKPSPAVAEPEQAAVRSCPVCLSEYAPKNRFCVRDGAELSEGGSSGPFAQGMICPTCRRGYPFDASFCPEDADELMPYGLYGAASATRSPLRLDANKICPECGVRDAPGHLFCGNDGTELVVLN